MTERTRKSPVLPLAFFDRPAAKVARDLIGKRLVRSHASIIRTVTITETEAYAGQHDLACHSSKGRTRRTEVMFGAAGHFYIYRIYGLHWMLNVVTGGMNEAAAVLVRGVDGVSGPGRVAAALAVDESLGGLEAAPASGLWFEAPQTTKRFRILSMPRVGIDYAGPVWTAKKLRFVMV